MNKNLPIIFLAGFTIIFILFLIFKNKKGEDYATAEYRISNLDFINRLIRSPLTLEEMIEGLQPFRNSPYWNSYYQLKEIVEYLQSPNLSRYWDEFIPGVYTILDSTDFQGRPRFPHQTREYIFDLIRAAELANENRWLGPPQGQAMGWGQPPAILLPNNVLPWLVGNNDFDVAAVPPVPVDEDEDDEDLNPPFPQDININLIPQPF